MIDIFIVDGTVNGFDKPTYNWGEHASLNRKVLCRSQTALMPQPSPDEAGTGLKKALVDDSIKETSATDNSYPLVMTNIAMV
jgi:hypothetical protein